MAAPQNGVDIHDRMGHCAHICEVGRRADRCNVFRIRRGRLNRHKRCSTSACDAPTRRVYPSAPLTSPQCARRSSRSEKEKEERKRKRRVKRKEKRTELNRMREKHQSSGLPVRGVDHTGGQPSVGHRAGTLPIGNAY
jgi:hypothetical protein